MRKTYVRILAVILAMLMLPVPSFAAADTTNYLLKVGFESAPTNGSHDNVTVDGSVNARVMEESASNKVLYLPTNAVDNVVEASGTDTLNADVYYVSFSLKTEGDFMGGNLQVRNALGTPTLLNFGEGGTVTTADGKEVGGLSSRYTTFTMKIDNRYQFIDIFVNDKIVLYRWKMSDKITNVYGTVFNIFSTGVEGTGVYLDNVKVYESSMMQKGRVTEPWNSETMEFVPAEEAVASEAVYINANMDNDAVIGGTLNKKSNIVEWKQEKDGNGYFDFVRTLPSNDMFFDMTGFKSSNFVLSVDVRYDGTPIETAQPFLLRDNTTGVTVNFWLPININSGAISGVGTLEKGKWSTIAVAFNMRRRTYDIYFNGTKVKEGGSIPNDFKTFSIWRFYIGGGTTEGAHLMVDNVRAYDGEAPRDLSDAAMAEAKSIYTNAEAETALRGKVALQAYSNKMWYNNRKIDTDLPCITSKYDAAVSIDTFSKLLGVTPTVNGDKINIDGVTMTMGSKEVTIGGVKYTMDLAPTVVDGNPMIPIATYGKHALGSRELYDDEHGMFIVKNKTDAYNFNDPRLEHANNFLFFDRDSAEVLAEKFIAQNDGGAKHPRLWLDEEDFDKLRKDVVSDPYKSAWYPTIQKRADEYFTKSLLEYGIVNSRLLHISNEAMIRIPTLALMYQISGEEKYAQRAVEEMKAVAAFQDWHPNHSLDSGTMAMAMALGYDWLYHYMSEEDRAEIVKGSKKNGIDTAWACYTGTSSALNLFWTQTQTNWAFIVNAGYCALAAVMAEDVGIDYAMEVYRSGLQSAEWAHYRIAPDGAWYEGPGYWSYGGGSLAYHMLNHRSLFGEDWNHGYMGLLEFGEFAVKSPDPKDIVNNFHDGTEGYMNDPLMFAIANDYDSTALAHGRIAFLEKNPNQLQVEDLIFYNTDMTPKLGSETLPLDSYWREVEMFTMRESYNDPEAAYVSAHGGFSNNAHDHIDEGTFVYNVGGVRWAIDIGTEDWSYVDNSINPAIQAGYSPYLFYRRKGEGHNIVVINPDMEGEMDQTKFAKVQDVVSGENAAYTSISLTDHYNKNVKSYTRGYMLHDGRRSFTVRDEIDLKHDNSDLYWFMHTKGEIIVQDNSTALIYQAGKILKVQFITDAPEAELTAAKAEKLPTSPKFKETANTGITKLSYKLKASGKVNITVKMSLLQDSGSLTPPADIPISEWTVEGAPAGVKGEHANIYPTMIYLDGVPIYGYPTATPMYAHSMNENGEVPEVTVDSPYRTEIINHVNEKNLSNYVEVRSYDDATGAFTPYMIRMDPWEDTSIGNYDRHKVIGAEVSSEQNEDAAQNLRTGSYDGDLATRWSAQGVGEWMIHDLGEVVDIDAFGLAFWMGSQRVFTYDIKVSTDGSDYRTILNRHSTSGTTEEIEIVPLDERVQARYIMFVGYGSNANAWNNVIELATLVKK